MNPQTKNTLKAIKETVYGFIAVAILGFMFKLYVFMTISQPDIDEKQNSQITFTKDWIKEVQTLTNEKNANTNARIDKTNDKIKPMDVKVDILIDLNKEALKRYKEIEKYFKLQGEK